jgi:Xaa-Pro aminopeptidase
MGIIKTRNEIKLLKKSAQITDSCIPIIEQSLKEEKITENEIVRRLRKNMKNQGATFSFQPIVACGKRSSKIHAMPRSTDKIISGIGLVDFGASYKGYKTDATVPFIKGKIGKREMKIVDSTLKAYKVAMNSLKYGMFCCELFDRVDNYMRKNDFQMAHSLGHGIGLKIHELPYIGTPKILRLLKKLKGKKRNRFEKKFGRKITKWKKIMETRFKNNMIFTIEPGIYVKGIGGCRLENDFLIENKRIKILTHSKLIKV